MKHFLGFRFSNCESGATLVEYALTCALIAVTLFSIGSALMGDVSTSMSKTGKLMGNASPVTFGEETEQDMP